MQNLMRKIRTYLDTSQAEFAEKIGVSFATVNRWENGRTEPTGMAQDKIFEFCCEKSVPVYDMIMQRIADTANTIELHPGHILLYHGSKSGIVGDIAPCSRKYCDFGQGFYMGTDPAQPLTLICDFPESKFYILSVDTRNLDTLEVSADINWAMLVAYNRGRMEKINGSPLYNKYRDMTRGKDIVIGDIANDRMFFVIDNFFVGNITDKALVNSLASLCLGKQYVALTEKACKAVCIEREVPISHLERLVLKKVAEENRAKGISFATDICKRYRRTGLFFDEILDQKSEE